MASSLSSTPSLAPSGKTSPVLIVITTLLIAALFQPFYRSKYDTRKTLEAFSARLRQDVDLSTLTGQLVNVLTLQTG